MMRLICLLLAGVVAGCVAPEAPPPPRPKPSAAAKPAVSTADFEDAPRPNRKMGAPSGDSIIKMGR